MLSRPQNQLSNKNAMPQDLNLTNYMPEVGLSRLIPVSGHESVAWMCKWTNGFAKL